MVSEATQAVARVDEASSPEDVFGGLSGSNEEQLQEAAYVYRSLARLVHPDAGGDTDAFAKLSNLWTECQSRIRAGVYGSVAAAAHGLRVSGRKHAYTLGYRVAHGDIADVYAATDEDATKVAFKLVRHHRNNDVMTNDWQMGRKVFREVDPQWRMYFPEPVESMMVRDPSTKVNRRANVTAMLDGFFTLAEVMAAYPNGVPPKDMAWMWRRVLVALGAAHQAGVIHGAVLPEHILIHPEQHGVVLVGWSAAVEDGGTISLLSSEYRDWYPPEVLGKKPASPETDIYLAARSFIALSGGMEGGLLPKAMRAHFRACLLPQAQRPGDAWETKDSFTDVLERLYGPRKFRPFVMPKRRS